MFKVIVNKNGKRYSVNNFEEFCTALDFAYKTNLKGEYFVLLLEQNATSKKWMKRLSLYPSEVC